MAAKDAEKDAEKDPAKTAGRRPAAPKAKTATGEGGDPGTLRRLGGGRWQTRDGRFTIEPESGTWAVVDAEQADELGLPLVRGPYRSLTEARAAIGEALATGERSSPLADRLEVARRRPPAPPGERPRRRPGAAPPAPAQPEPEPAAEVPPATPADELPEGVEVETIYVVEAAYGPDALARRAPVRRDHLARIAGLIRDGRVVEAGGFLDASSALLFVRAESEDEAVRLLRDDVYVEAGVWSSDFTVRPYARVVVTGPPSPRRHR